MTVTMPTWGTICQPLHKTWSPYLKPFQRYFRGTKNLKWVTWSDHTPFRDTLWTVWRDLLWSILTPNLISMFTHYEDVKGNAEYRNKKCTQRAQTSADPEDPDFGLWTPGSEAWSGSPPKLYYLVLEPCPTPPKNFVKIRSQVCK